MRQWITHYPVYLFVRLIICLLQMLSPNACTQLARGFAHLAHNVLRLRRRVVEENLRLAFPDWNDVQIRRTALQMWEHLLIMGAEIATAQRKLHETNWRDHLCVIRRPELVEQLLSARPTVVVSGHFGNFELGGYMLSLFGFPTYTVARTLDNPYLDQFINSFRGSKGQHILPKIGSAPMIDHLLEHGETLTVLGDQQAGPKGCWVQFFGRAASTNKGIALFALSNDAPLLVCYARRTGGPLAIEIGIAASCDPRELSPEAATVSALTEWFTTQLEQSIRESPEQYWWVHRRWKGEPRSRGRAQAAEPPQAEAA